MIRPDYRMEDSINIAPAFAPVVRASTFFGLLAEFGTTQIPLAKVSEKYFGMSERQAKEKAAAQHLPVPAFRIGSQKSPWYVSAADLSAHIDACREAGSDRWAANNGGAAA